MKRIVVAFSIICLSYAFPMRAFGDLLFFSVPDGISEIQSVNTSNFNGRTLLTYPQIIDSVAFDTHGRILFTVPHDFPNSPIGLGTLHRFNPTTGKDQVIASGLDNPTEFILEPGGKTALICETGRIDRLNLLTKTLSPFANTGGNPEGLTYDNSGRLFANVDLPDGSRVVAQLDPQTGAILHQSPNLVAFALTFDPFTDKLYASALLGGGIHVLDPNDLSTEHLLPNAGQLAGDGLAANGKGLLFTGTNNGPFDSTVAVYDLTKQHEIVEFSVGSFFGSSADLDFAPVTGPGSQAAPEPTTIVMLGIAMGAGLFARCWRSRNRLRARRIGF